MTPGNYAHAYNDPPSPAKPPTTTELHRMAAMIDAGSPGEDASEGPATLPMMRVVSPIVGGLLMVPAGVRFVQIGAYRSIDADLLAGEPGRMLATGDGVALAVDCLDEEAAMAILAAIPFSASPSSAVPLGRSSG